MGSLPGLVVGAGNRMVLSDKDLQLVFLQFSREFPFQPVGHLLPGVASGFHLFEHSQCVCQGAVFVVSLVVVLSLKGLGECLAEAVAERLFVHRFVRRCDGVPQSPRLVPVWALATGTTDWLVWLAGPPGFAAALTVLLLESGRGFTSR